MQAEELLNNSVGGGAAPSGEVVGIVQRGVGEVVATISEADERALLTKQDVGRQVRHSFAASVFAHARSCDRMCVRVCVEDG